MQLQKSAETLDIDGHAISPGCRVTVRWRGVWYDGTVIRLGPQRKLCKVCDLATSEMLLAEREQLKLRESRLMGGRLSPGALVMYNDGESWREGRVESCNATGAALVRWRTPLARKNESWFELGDVGPVIPNEAYHGYDKFLLEASKSELQLEDAITQRPRTTHNVLYHSDSECSENGSPVTATASGSRKLQNKGITTSPTYESIGSDTVNPYDRLPPRPPPPRKGMPHPGMPRPYAMGRPAHAPSSRSHHSHQRPAMGGLRMTLGQSSLPCAYSYINNVRGIPPHSSSLFFQQLHRNYFPAPGAKAVRFLPTRHGARSAEPQPRSVSTTKPSPTWTSEPHLDPTPYAEQLFVPSHFKTRKASPRKTPGGRNPPVRSATRGIQSRSIPPQHKKAVPLPYEIPQRQRRTGFDLRKQEYVSRAQHIQQHTGRSQGDRVDYAQIDFSRQRRKRQVAPTETSTSPTHVRVTARGSTLLTCTAKNSGPVTYHWLKKGKDISKDDCHITQPAPGLLQIKEATQEDKGYYSCVISNQYGSVTKVFHLEIVTDPLSASGSKVSTDSSKHTRQPKTAYTNKVTYEELSFGQPDSRRPHPDPFPRDPDTAQRKRDAREGRGREESKGISTGEIEPAEKAAEDGKRTDTVMVTSERKMKHNRNRVSSVLRNDIDQYLEGYGEDYGAISSATDLEQEGLQQFAPVDVVKNIDMMTARKTPEENRRKFVHSAQAKVDLDQKTSTKNRRKLLQLPKLPRTPKFRKKSKIGDGVLRRGTDEVQMISRIRDIPEPGKPVEGWKAESPHVESTGRSPKQTGVEEANATSVVVNTSTGSSDSGFSLRNAESEGVPLPLDTESVSDQVRRLQLSVQAYTPENFGSPSKIKRKGFISSLFASKNKLVTATV